jgi:two-component system, OmpR family, sensor histidine kinase QseC
VRYAPEGSAVTLRFGAEVVEVDNDGPPLSADALSHLGERFHRVGGQSENGSGLGVSIAMRVAELHGLALSFQARADGSGLLASLSTRGRVSSP